VVVAAAAATQKKMLYWVGDLVEAAAQEAGTEECGRQQNTAEVAEEAAVHALQHTPVVKEGQHYA
jgi:hypothetical protein